MKHEAEHVWQQEGSNKRKEILEKYDQRKRARKFAPAQPVWRHDSKVEMDVSVEPTAPASASCSNENPAASTFTWYCKADKNWEAYPADICQLLEIQYQHVLQGTSAVVVPYQWSQKSNYQIDVRTMQQKNIVTGKTRDLKRVASSRLIARQADSHSSVMIRSKRSTCTGKDRSTVKWWLPSGTPVLSLEEAAIQGYREITFLPNMTNCEDNAGGALNEWPQAKGYIKSHNLIMEEDWEIEEQSKGEMLALVDVEAGVWSSER